MATSITGSIVFNATGSIPAIGDNGATYNTAVGNTFQTLLNSIYYLQQNTKSARNLVRHNIPILNLREEVGNELWSYHADEFGMIQFDVSGNGGAKIELDLPPGVTITELRASVKGGFGGSHSALPAVMPVVALFKQDPVTGTTTNLAFLTDPSPDHATYDAQHYITVVVPSVVVSKDLRYFMAMAGETSTNSIASRLVLMGADISWTRP